MKRGTADARQRSLLALVLTASLWLVASPARAVDWVPFPLPAPPGGQFSTPPGTPGDLAFWAPNRGVMTVAGNASVPSGLYSWNGSEWHQLATVCGPTALELGEGAITWAGPRELWTVARVSPGVLNASGSLCHFKDGAVVGSFAAPNVPSYTQRLNAAACLSPTDCWFGGPQARSEDGSRVGAFHLRWDGIGLTPVYGTQGRAVSDLQAHGGRLFESVRMGAGMFDASPAVLRDPEPVPALLHRIDGGAFSNDPWTPAPVEGLPVDGTELRALDSDGATAWAVGGGARSGPASRAGDVQRLPVAARLDDDRWVELPISGTGLRSDEVFTDVAAIPGTQTAWAVLRPGGPIPDLQRQPRIAHIAADGEVTVHQLGQAGIDPARGDAMYVACPAADDCWLATARGYLFRWGGSPYAVDDDPAFQGTITERPNEGAAQFLPDTPPGDDSRLFAPPVEVPVQNEEPPATCRRPARLMDGVKPPRRELVAGQRRSARNPRFRLTVRFRLARRARVSLIAERVVPVRGARRRGRTRVVARTRLALLRPGSRALTVVVRRKTWPSRLRFVLREAGRLRCETAATRTASTR